MATDKLPPRKIISERVEAQRRRVWHAQAICGITALGARTVQDGDSEAGRFAQNAYSAVEAMSELLDSIAGKLEGDVVLDARVGEEDEPEVGPQP